jgi:tRNA (guanine-N7-)-methyltransferase
MIERTTIEIERIIVPPPAPDERFDLAACFERAAPTELEIGVGKGGFILRVARTHPERNYLGIEWANQYYRHAADRLARWGVTNVRILRTDARHFVIHQLPAASLAALHVYHPDPWPKTRHHKRRLFQPAFVQALGRVLQPGGRVFIQTDHAEYFAIIAALVSAEPALQVMPEASDGATGPETNFEIKYRREGRPIYRLEVARRLVCGGAESSDG